MTHADEQRIFNDARQIAEPDDRRAYIERACGGDTALQSRIEALLKVMADEPNFLEKPVLAAMSTMAVTTGRPDAMIGRYRLIEVIGVGGMGEVWTAEQQEPIKRFVALKLIKAEKDSRQVLARFDVERQALAVMDHPNIARIIDAGESSPTATGGHSRPYFVMELVQGVSITRYCDEHHLTPKERLELFIPVCHAIQHAHQKGIIHRDLKPSNVLIAEVDGRPTPKIIDFGVAKAIDVKLADVSLETNFGTVVGTPQYMSPEQADTKNLDVDTRTDIYSLGVLLYELLTGSPPFDKKSLAEAGILEVLRVIREVEPPTPSSKLSSEDALPSIAANRNIEPKQLTSLLRRDLDWIVMKSLEKDRDRRYASASGLARDIEHYLNNEPVEAGPPSAGYKFRKFLRRNRGPVVAATLLVLSLIGGIIGTTIGMKQAEQGRLVAQQQRERAERHYQRALSAVDRLLTRVGGVRLESVPHLDETRRRILEDALEFYREILKDEGNDPVVRREIGLAHQRIGYIQIALGRHQEAEESLHRAIDVQRQLVADFANEPKYEIDFVRSHRHLAFDWYRCGRMSDAERLFKEMLSRKPIKSPDAQYDRMTIHFLAGWVYSATRRPDEATSSCKEALAMADELVRSEVANDDYPLQRANILAFLGDLFRESRHLDDAEKCLRDGSDTLERLLARNPENVNLRHCFAGVCINLGLTCADLNRSAEAEAAYGKAIALNSSLARDHPKVLAYKWGLAKAHNNLALIHSKNDDPVRAAAENENALRVFEELMQSYPQRLEFAATYAVGCGNQAKYLNEQRRWEDSLVWNTKAIDAADGVLKVEPRHTDAHQYLFNSLIGRAWTYRRLNRHDLAIKDYRRAVELSEGERYVNFVNYRPRALAYIGEHAKAAAEAEAIVANANATSLNFKEMACVYSTCVEAAGEDKSFTDDERAKLVERYATRSMELLKKAAEKGHFPTPERVADLRTDDRLKSIRERDDFKKLLVELEEKAKPAPKSKDKSQ